MKKQDEKKLIIYLRNFIFGIDDSLVSTVGLISGVAVAGTSKSTIIITGVVLIFVEAFSMGAGSLVSEHSAESYVKKNPKGLRSFTVGALIMFVSYFVAGFIPLLPYILFDVNLAFWLAIAFSLTALFTLGVINAKIFKVKVLRSGLEMLIIGGLAITIGVTVGRLLEFIK